MLQYCNWESYWKFSLVFHTIYQPPSVSLSYVYKLRYSLLNKVLRFDVRGPRFVSTLASIQIRLITVTEVFEKVEVHPTLPRDKGSFDNTQTGRQKKDKKQED